MSKIGLSLYNAFSQLNFDLFSGLNHSLWKRSCTEGNDYIKNRKVTPRKRQNSQFTKFKDRKLKYSHTQLHMNKRNTLMQPIGDIYLYFIKIECL